MLKGRIYNVDVLVVSLLRRMCTTRGGTTGKSPTAAGTTCPTTRTISPISTRSVFVLTIMIQRRDGTTSTHDTTTRTSAGSSARTRSSAPTAVCWGTICMLTATTTPLCLWIRAGCVIFERQMVLIAI